MRHVFWSSCFLLVALYESHSAPYCPVAYITGCECGWDDEVLLIITCTSLGILEQVPEIRGNGSVISFQDFQISPENTIVKKLQDNAFRGGRMRNLKLRSLLISEVGPGALRGLEGHLESLFLDDNNISSLPESVFSGQSSLRYLHISGNKISSLDRRIFWDLESLVSLQLQNNLIEYLPLDSFSGLMSIEDIYLDRNFLTQIPLGLFNRLKTLEGLSITENAIETVDPEAFRNMTQLETLNLNRNDITDISKYLLVDNGNLKDLDLSFNNISEIPVGFLSSSNLQDLVSLSLAYNRITTFPASTFILLEKLETLLLRNNKLSDLPENVFENLKNLKALHLQENLLEKIETKSLTGLSALTELLLQGNRLNYIGNGAFDVLGNVKMFDLSRNMLTDVSVTTETPFSAMQRLEELDVRFNQLEEIGVDLFMTLTELKELLLSNNHIVTIMPGAFRNLKALEILDLSDNRISDIPPGLFSNLSVGTNLTLNLARNPLLNISRDSFHGLERLVELDLSNTCPELHGEDIFQHLHSIKHINLRHTALLNSSSAIFSNLTSLRSLDLVHTGITHFRDGGFTENLRSLKLGFNRLFCDCSLVWLRTVSAFTDFADVLCDADSPRQAGRYYAACYSSEGCVGVTSPTTTPVAEFCDGSLFVSVNEENRVDNPVFSEYVDKNVCTKHLAEEEPEKDMTTSMPENNVTVDSSTIKPIRYIYISIEVVANMGGGSVTVRWVVERRPNFDVTESLVDIRDIRDSNVPVFLNTTDSFQLQYPIDAFRPNAQYRTCIVVTLSNSDRNNTCANRVFNARLPDPTARATPEEESFPLVLTLVVALVGGVVLLFILIVTIACCVAKRRRRQQTRKEQELEKEGIVEPSFDTSTLPTISPQESLVEHYSVEVNPRRESILANGKEQR